MLMTHVWHCIIQTHITKFNFWLPAESFSWKTNGFWTYPIENRTQCSLFLVNSIQEFREHKRIALITGYSAESVTVYLTPANHLSVMCIWWTILIGQRHFWKADSSVTVLELLSFRGTRSSQDPLLRQQYAPQAPLSLEASPTITFVSVTKLLPSFNT